MSRGKFEYMWVPFINAPKHTINNSDLVCMTQNGHLHLCKFENEQFTEMDGTSINDVVLYQNNPRLANSMRDVIYYMAGLDKK